MIEPQMRNDESGQELSFCPARLAFAK